MRFTVEPEPLIKMVAMVGEWLPKRKQAEVALHLIACAGRVYVESQDTVAETDAAVWEDGQCAVSRGKLLDALKAHRWESSLTILADDRGLQVGQLTMPVSGYLSRTKPPSAFQIFLATESGVVSSRIASDPLRAAAA